jgi:hypothetical protein
LFINIQREWGNMPEKNDRIPEICQKISIETDSKKMADLVRELNQELSKNDGKKDSDGVSEPKTNIPRSA